MRRPPRIPKAGLEQAVAETVKDQVIECTYQARSRQEAEEVANGLRQLEGCLDARVNVWSATAYFAMDRDIPPETLPDGCRIVPASVLVFLQRRDGVTTKQGAKE